MHDEVRASARRGETTFARAVRQVKTTGFARAAVVLGEAWHDVLDVLANAIVVVRERLPGYGRARAEGLLRHARDDRRLALQVFRGRGQQAVRGVHDSRRVFDRHELLAARLFVALRA